MNLPEDLWLALVAGLGLVLATSPFGCVIVWRRMAFFGEMIAHTALLGAALGLIIGIEPIIGIILVCFVAALMMMRTSYLPADTMLGVISHIMLAFGLLLLAGNDEHVHEVLFGDILSLTWLDVAIIYGVNLAALIGLALIWRPLLLLLVSEEIARAENINVNAINLAFMLLFVLVVAIGMQITGVFLIVALTIIPAAAARGFAKTPTQMAGYAIIFGIFCVICGLSSSFIFTTPPGATIITFAAVVFVLSLAVQTLTSKVRPRKI